MNLKTGPGQKSRRERDWESHNRRQTERNTRTGRFAICRNINKQPDCKSGWMITEKEAPAIRHPPLSDTLRTDYSITA